MNHHVIGGRKGGRRRSKLLSPEARSAIARKGAEARWSKHMKKKRFNEDELEAMEKEGLRPDDMPTEEEIEESKKLLESIRNGTAKLYPHKLRPNK